jgi:hypothetical protein
VIEQHSLLTLDSQQQPQPTKRHSHERESEEGLNHIGYLDASTSAAIGTSLVTPVWCTKLGQSKGKPSNLARSCVSSKGKRKIPKVGRESLLRNTEQFVILYVC